MNLSLKKLAWSLILVFACASLSVILFSTQLFDHYSNSLSHGLYLERDVSEDIVIIGADSKSMLPREEGGLGSQLTWTKEHYAVVIEKAKNAGAEAIFYDWMLRDLSNHITQQDLSNILSDVESFEELGLELQTALGSNPQDEYFAEVMDSSVYLLKIPNGAEIGDMKVPMIIDSAHSHPKFVNKSSEIYSFQITEEENDAIYSMPIVYENENGELEESLSAQFARKLLNSDYQGKLEEEHYVFDESRRIPIQNGSFLINYVAKSYSFPSFSFADVYYGDFEAQQLDGKVVLIGPTAATLQDRHFTPIDSETPMPGVEIQANAIQTILDGEFLQKQSMAGFIVLTFMLVAIAVAASMYLPIVWGSAVVALELIAFPFYAQWAFKNGTIPNLIWPVFAVVLAYFATLTYRNFTEFREKRQLTKAFGQYVSPELVAHIQANPDQLKLGGERREITALFLDIENFTTLSESLEPSEVVRVINTYFDALAKVIMGNEGTVDKYEGDAIMALFGAPVMIENHALKACRAAMAIRSKVLELNQVTGQNLNVRVGLATGPAIVGNMGSADRFDYTAMGDTVNTASRLEGANKFYGTRILVNPGTMQAAQTQILFRRVDRVRLKGKTEALDIYEVMGPMESVSEQGKAVVNTWHQALEYYRNQDWLNAESRIQQVQQVMPGDGPSQAYLERISGLKAQPPQGWDGTWTWKTKG